MEGGDPKVIPNSEGANTTPSIVRFHDSGEKLVGQAAKRQAITNPDKTIFEAKRLIGRKFTSKEVQEFIKIDPFKSLRGQERRRLDQGGRPRVSALRRSRPSSSRKMKKTGRGLPR